MQSLLINLYYDEYNGSNNYIIKLTLSEDNGTLIPYMGEGLGMRVVINIHGSYSHHPVSFTTRSSLEGRRSFFTR
jgi:hypothetical protein